MFHDKTEGQWGQGAEADERGVTYRGGKRGLARIRKKRNKGLQTASYKNSFGELLSISTRVEPFLPFLIFDMSRCNIVIKRSRGKLFG